MDTVVTVFAVLGIAWCVLVGVMEFRAEKRARYRIVKRAAMETREFMNSLSQRNSLGIQRAEWTRRAIARIAKLSEHSIYPSDRLEDLGFSPIGEDELDELFEQIRVLCPGATRDCLHTYMTVTDVFRILEDTDAEQSTSACRS